MSMLISIVMLYVIYWVVPVIIIVNAIGIVAFTIKMIYELVR